MEDLNRRLDRHCEILCHRYKTPLSKLSVTITKCHIEEIDPLLQIMILNKRAIPVILCETIERGVSSFKLMNLGAFNDIEKFKGKDAPYRDLSHYLNDIAYQHYISLHKQIQENKQDLLSFDGTRILMKADKFKCECEQITHNIDEYLSKGKKSPSMEKRSQGNYNGLVQERCLARQPVDVSIFYEVRTAEVV